MTSTFTLAARTRLSQAQIRSARTIPPPHLLFRKCGVAATTTSSSSSSSTSSPLPSTSPLPPSPESINSTRRLKKNRGITIAPGPELHGVLVRARSLYGAGLGLESLRVLAEVVRATIGHQWYFDDDHNDGGMMNLSSYSSSSSGSSSEGDSNSSEESEDEEYIHHPSHVGPSSNNNLLTSSPPSSSSSTLETIFAEIDADISQALQSTREELESGRVGGVGGGNPNDKTIARDALNQLRNAVEDSMRDVEQWGGVYPFERAAASLEFWKI